MAPPASQAPVLCLHRWHFVGRGLSEECPLPSSPQSTSAGLGLILLTAEFLDTPLHSGLQGQRRLLSLGLRNKGPSLESRAILKNQKAGALQWTNGSPSKDAPRPTPTPGLGMWSHLEAGSVQE